MSSWVLICLIPPALILLLWLVFRIGLWIEDGFFKIRWYLLQQHGEETEGVMLESEEYTGPGLHSYDPCFRGKYQFTDHRGKVRRYTFKNRCYDQYDAARKIGFDALRAAYRPNAPLRVRYYRAFPRIHYVITRTKPDTKEPDLVL